MLLQANLGKSAMDKEELQKKIREEEDFIRCPKCGNSLVRFLMKNSEGIENHVIARLLMIPEEEVERLYEEAVKKLREEMLDKE